MEHENIIGFVGRSNSGKTTVIEKIIPWFNEHNYKIAIIKHTVHDLAIDQEGKDSYRFTEAGASTVVITNDEKMAMFSQDRKLPSPLLLAKIFLESGTDLVILEGYKKLNIQKIEVVGESQEAPLFESGIDNIVGIVSDKKIGATLPVFTCNDVENICSFILAKAIK